MQERISQLLKGTQFFDYGIVTFASNHPDHVCLLEIKNDNNELFTLLYDKNHDFLSINKQIDPVDTMNEEETNMENIHIEISEQRKQEIMELLDASKNNAGE